MCLRFTFLLITRVTAWLRLSRREEAWKTAEILILRHQLAVLQRRYPRRPTVNWADRALAAELRRPANRDRSLGRPQRRDAAAGLRPLRRRNGGRVDRPNGRHAATAGRPRRPTREQMTRPTEPLATAQAHG